MELETWRFINTFAPWLSAIGTISAVVVSLYLAQSEKPVRLEVRAGHRIIIDPGRKDEPPEFLYIGAINTGHRVVTITNVGWKLGLFKKRHGMQIVQKDLYSSGVPVQIDDGEEAKWLIPLGRRDNWIERFSREFLQPRPRWNLFWLRLQIHTSVGKTFGARIESGLRKKLLEECRRQVRSTNASDQPGAQGDGR